MNFIGTLNDLYNLVGENPFVWTMLGKGSDNLNQLIKDGSGHIIEYNLISEESFSHNRGNPVLSIILVDYFDSTAEHSKQTSTGGCSCEWVNVLQNGCKCGAIEPYEMRKFG